MSTEHIASWMLMQTNVSMAWSVVQLYSSTWQERVRISATCRQPVARGKVFPDELKSRELLKVSSKLPPNNSKSSHWHVNPHDYKRTLHCHYLASYIVTSKPWSYMASTAITFSTIASPQLVNLQTCSPLVKCGLVSYWVCSAPRLDNSINVHWVC